MSMFSNESAKLIGLDVVRAHWPHLTGAGVKILQVEWEQDGTFHRDEVKKVMAEIAPGATILFSNESPFYNGLCNFLGFGNIGWWRYGEPPFADWDIECHAYTATRGGLTDQKAGQAQDRRIDRDGVLAFAASGNDLAAVRGEWHRSRRTGMCGTPGSPAGIFNMGSLYGTQPYPDLIVPTAHTSIAAPVAAACAALLLQMGFDVDAYEFAKDAGGSLRIDLTAARLLGVAVEEPVPPAPPPVTWEAVDELVQSAPLSWAPEEAVQARVVIERRRKYERSSAGDIRNEVFYGIERTESRTVGLPQ